MRVASLFLCAVVLACCGAFTRSTALPGRSATGSVIATSARSTATPSPAASGTVRYIAIGASDSVGVGASDPATGSWPARVAALLPPGSAFVNLGISGSVASQAKDQQLPSAVSQRPTAVTVWLAVNDMNASVDAASYQAALDAIVAGLASRTDAKIFVGNVPDVRGVPAYKDVDKNALGAQIVAYNDAVASVVSRHPGRAYLVDLFTGSAPLVSTLTVSADGFHPSDEGYKLIADRFAMAMRAAGVPLRG